VFFRLLKGEHTDHVGIKFIGRKKLEDRAQVGRKDVLQWRYGEDNTLNKPERVAYGRQVSSWEDGRRVVSEIWYHQLQDEVSLAPTPHRPHFDQVKEAGAGF
jgi:hypothetical protein